MMCIVTDALGGKRGAQGLRVWARMSGHMSVGAIFIIGHSGHMPMIFEAPEFLKLVVL